MFSSIPRYTIGKIDNMSLIFYNAISATFHYESSYINDIDNFILLKSRIVSCFRYLFSSFYNPQFKEYYSRITIENFLKNFISFIKYNLSINSRNIDNVNIFLLNQINHNNIILGVLLYGIRYFYYSL
jgi:hypothetical protein